MVEVVDTPPCRSLLPQFCCRGSNRTRFVRKMWVDTSRIPCPLLGTHHRDSIRTWSRYKFSERSNLRRNKFLIIFTSFESNVILTFTEGTLCRGDLVWTTSVRGLPAAELPSSAELGFVCCEDIGDFGNFRDLGG